MCTLQKHYNYYQKNKKMLNDKFANQYIVISDNFEISGFDDRLEAYTFGTLTYGLGHFMLQDCRNDGMTVNTYSSTPYKAI